MTSSIEMTRRDLIRAASVVAASGAASGVSFAQAYPSQNITLVVPFPAGGIVDSISRRMSDTLGKLLGKPVMIENKPGAGGTIGAGQVARSRGDGHTLLAVFDTHAVSHLLYKVNFNAETELAPIALIATSPLALVVHRSVPANTVAELVQQSKASPDKFNYASTGMGSSNHLTTELFKTVSGASMTHVPYRGGAPAIQDLVSGNVQAMFVSVTSVLAHIQSGTLRPLAVTTRERIPALPNVPTIGDTYADFEVRSWVGLFAPASTPPDIVRKLNSVVNEAIRSPELVQFFQTQALTPVGGAPEAFGNFVKSETAKWGAVIQRQNIRAE